MKKRYVFFLVSITLILLSYNAHSQIKLGLQLGANFANTKFTPDPDFECENKTFFMGGALAEIKISNMFYIQPEVNYLSKGSSTKTVFNTISYTAVVDLIFNYYEIPINVLAKFDAGNFKPFIFAGPSLSFLSKATVKSESSETDILENLEKTDLSVNFGAGGEFKLSNSIGLFIMARYSLGLTDISKAEDEEIKNQGIAIMAGFKFSF